MMHVPHVPHVLVVDDEEAITYIFRRYLEAAGYRVTTAQDGVEALARFDDADTIDALVTDARMPRMGGDELIARLRPRYPSLPITVVSAYPMEVRASGQGLRVLAKPIEGAALVAAVAGMLAAQPGAGQPPAPLI